MVICQLVRQLLGVFSLCVQKQVFRSFQLEANLSFAH